VDKELSGIQVRELVLPNGEPKGTDGDQPKTDRARRLEKNGLLALGYSYESNVPAQKHNQGRDRLGFI